MMRQLVQLEERIEEKEREKVDNVNLANDLGREIHTINEQLDMLKVLLCVIH
jgi:hypothetical protein